MAHYRFFKEITIVATQPCGQARKVDKPLSVVIALRLAVVVRGIG